MSLHYRNEQGEFVKYDLPVLKGEKGDTPEGVVSAQPNSIPQRNAGGNLFTGQTLGFEKTDGSFLGGVHITELGELMHSIPGAGLTSILTQDKFPLATGTFNPRGKLQDSTTFTHNTDSTWGYYIRIGELVYVQGRIVVTSKNGAGAGKFVIGGLPFKPRYSGQTLNIGIASGLIYPDAAKEIKTYLESGKAEAQFYYNRTQYSYQVFTTTQLADTLDIYFSGVYRIIPE